MTPQKPLTASIVISTCNRASYLQRLLSTLTNVQGVPFEIVIVNGPSTDGTENILKQYEGFIKVVSYAGRNLSVSRNLGIAQAAGDIVVFIDDDALPANDNWLAEYLQAFQQNPHISMAWGPVLHRDADWFEFQGGATSEYGFQSFHETSFSEKAPDGTLWVARAPGGNMAFRRETLRTIGGFDEAYEYYLDETDVCFRMKRAGYEGLFLASNNIRHYAARSEQGQSIYDRNWDVITKSDTYFALKNSGDAFFTRLLKTLRFANQKHFVIEIDSYFQKQEISRSHWLRLRWKWLRGLLAGLLIGIFQPMKLGSFNSAPAPFLPFGKPPLPLLTASIVISTCNRAPYLQRLLSTLTNVQGVPFEIVIVNGPSTDGTENILKQYEGFIKVVSYTQKNVSASRNLGIAHAAGDIVVFIDDDALPTNEDWLAEYIRTFQENPHISMAWGPALHRDTDWYEFRGGGTSDYGFQSFHETSFSEKAPDGTLWVAGAPGGNMAFRRETLRAIGGFDETYKYYLGETDVSIRATRAGNSGISLDANSIRHFAASSERRRNIYDRNWDVIARSDTYYALKHGRDGFFTRLLKTLRFANQKHFVIEIDSYLQKKQITFSHWLRLRWMWLRGLMTGFILGIFQPMKLGSFNSAPAPFLPFGKPPLPVLNASIVINTFNRAPYLRRLLAGLIHLKNAQFEVIVVNGPSTDETEDILKQYEGFIKVVSYAGRNLSVSRNLGIAQASGDIVVFIDDDALPANDNWLAEYLQVFQQNLSLGMAWGSVLHRDADWFEFQGGATSEYAFQSFREPAVDEKAPDGTAWVAGGSGNNIVFRRANLIEVGGFDEAYKYYLDETDVCFRMNQAGYEGLFLPTNNIRHFAASSERRRSIYNRNWDVITKSDTYFALKNSGDSFFTRLLKTLRFANQKHFVIEIDSYFQKQEISRSHWLRLRWKWLRGLLAGLLIGIFQPRKFGVFNSSPTPFLPFRSNPTQAPLRIALITKNYPGQASFKGSGIGRYTYDLARGLHELGHQVHLICSDESPRASESLNFSIHGITQAEIDSIYTNLPDLHIVSRNIAFSVAVERKLKNLYQQGIEFDVVHATNWDIESISLIRERIYPVALMLVTPLAQVIQTEQWECNKDLQTSIQLDRWHIQQADVVCVPSNGVLKSYKNLMGITPQEMQSLQVTPLGIVPKNKTAIVERKSHKKLLYVGRLERRKGIHTLLEILPELMPNFPDWECHIVGADSPQPEGSLTYTQQFEEDHAQSAWFKRVIFHGAVSEEDLLAHYQTCDLFTAPSLFESFGLIYQEAMQFAKPVIGCRTGGIPEVVENGKEGILIEPDNPTELKQALTTLMSDEALRNSMGLAGYERIHQRDNYLSMASRLEQVYREIIQAKGKEYSQRRKSLWATS